MRIHPDSYKTPAFSFCLGIAGISYETTLESPILIATGLTHE
jgi:hypothetical protein